LLATIPGCETVERISETEYAAALRVVVGPLKLKFRGKILLSDLDPPWRYTISCEGNGGLSGFARGTARVTMAPDPYDPDGRGTVLRYEAEAALGGMVATFAEKLLHGTASRLSDSFFAQFAANIPKPSSIKTEISPPPLESVESRPNMPDNAIHQPGLHPVVWSLGLAIVTGSILAIFAR